MAEMTREQWLKAVFELEPHLREIEKILNQNRIDHISICSDIKKGVTRVTHIYDSDEGERTYYCMNMEKHETWLEENFEKYYSKS